MSKTRERTKLDARDAGAPAIVVVNTGIQLVEQELNEWHALGYYMHSAPQVFVVPGVGDALPGVYALVILERDEFRRKNEEAQR